MADQPAPNHEQAVGSIEIDPQWRFTDDTDSAYGDQISTFSTSISSGVFDYQYENGRRYHAYDAGSYPMPNDEKESDRMDCFHEMMMVLHEGRLHMAPIGPSPQRILDLGTGTGIWAIEMGDAYPSAEITGNDLSPIQPTMVPPNVRFIVDNIEKPWAEPHQYDYIHCRYLTAAIQNWDDLVEQVYINLHPGGWAEFADYDIMFHSHDDTLRNTALHQWIVDILDSCNKMGCEPCPGPKLKERMLAAGFEDVHEHVYEIPTGQWPLNKKMKNLGLWSAVHLLKGLEAFTLALFTRVLHWSVEQTQVFLSQVRKDLNNPSIHCYQKYYVVYGRKPQGRAVEPEPTPEPALQSASEPASEPVPERVPEPISQPTAPPQAPPS